MPITTYGQGKGKQWLALNANFQTLPTGNETFLIPLT